MWFMLPCDFLFSMQHKMSFAGVSHKFKVYGGLLSSETDKNSIIKHIKVFLKYVLPYVAIMTRYKRNKGACLSNLKLHLQQITQIY